MEKLIHPEISYKIGGVVFSAHNNLGQFCNEQQYGDFIENEFIKKSIKYEREKIVPLSFENEFRGRNKIDFLVEDNVVLEIKAKRIVTTEDYYQVKRYLVAFDKKLGILVNFRVKYVTPKRILNSSAKS